MELKVKHRLSTQGHFTHETESPWPWHWALSLVEKAELVKFTLHYAWGTNKVYMWLEDGRIVYMDSYMAFGPCVIVIWIIFKNHLLEVGLTQKSGNRDILNAHNRWFILCCHVWGPTWIEIHWNSIRLRPNHIWLHTTLEDPWPHYMILEVSWENL
jgi:hypothetical protein